MMSLLSNVIAVVSFSAILLASIISYLWVVNTNIDFIKKLIENKSEQYLSLADCYCSLSFYANIGKTPYWRQYL